MKLGFDSTGLSILQHKRIYFGHQSVGRNIVGGLRDIGRADPTRRLNIIESASPYVFAGPVFAHSPIGQNGEPRTKIDTFSEHLAAGIGRRSDVALMKMCYVDVTEQTDIAALFAYYQVVMKQIAAAYPNMRIVHTTIPVTVMPGPLSRLAGAIRGRRNRIAYDNLVRAEYNGMLVQAYDNREPIFDLATAESTTPSGHLTRHAVGGKPVATLVPAYSSDGRHLSELGRRIVASRLIDCLVGAVSDRPNTTLRPNNDQ